MTFFPNQITAAKKIVEQFKVGANYTILLAEMQSGKTDSFMLAGAELIREGLVDRFVVFSGNAEKALKKQAKNQKDFWRKYRKYIRTFLDEAATNDASEMVEDTWGEDSVIWSSDLLKWTRCTGKKILFIWDESHYAQSGPSLGNGKGNRPSQFFKKLGLKANGAPNRDGDLMLSVSATPFSEILANENQASPKAVVYMKPGDSYRGIAKMMVDGQIKTYKKSELMTTFERLALSVKTSGVGIIRATGQQNVDKLITKCSTLGVKCHLHDEKDTQDINVLLCGSEEGAHPHTGVIIVKGKVKMGKQIQKHRLCWVMETALNPNTDTFLQGLAGRCMGYPESSGAHAGVKIYVSEKYFNTGDAEKYIDMMDYFARNGTADVTLQVPSRAMNVAKQKSSKKKNGLYPTIPDKIVLDLSEWDRDRTREDLVRVVMDHIFSSAYTTKNDTNHIKTLKGNVKSLTFSSLLGNESHEGHKEALEKCVATNTVLSSPGSSCGVRANGSEIKVWTDNWRETERSGENPVCYIQYLSTKPGPDALPETTGIEVFSNQLETGEIIMGNGLSQMFLKPETASNITDMKSAIEYLVQQTTGDDIPSSISTSRSIVSNATTESPEWKGVAVSQDVHKSLKYGGEIYKYIFETYNAKLKTTKAKYKPSGFPSHLVRLSSIKW